MKVLEDIERELRRGKALVVIAFKKPSVFEAVLHWRNSPLGGEITCTGKTLKQALERSVLASKGKI